MPTFGDFSYAEQKQLYAGAPVEETKSTLAALDKSYWDQKNIADQTEIAIKSLPVHKENEHLRDEVVGYLSGLDEIRKNNNWEAAGNINSDIAKKIATHRGFNQALLNKKNDDEAQARAQEIQAKTGKNALVFTYGQSPIAVNPDGSLNTYRPDVEPELDYGTKAQEIWHNLIFNAGVLKGSPELDATAGLIRQGKWKEISPERINQLVDYATKVFSETEEGQQYFRKQKWIDKSKDPQSELKKLVQSAGMLKTFVQTDEEISNWQMALMQAEAAKKAAEEAQKYQHVNPMTFQGYVKGNTVPSYGALESKLEESQQQVAAAKIIFDTQSKDIRAKRGDFDINQFDDKGNYIPAMIYDSSGNFLNIDNTKIQEVFGEDYTKVKEAVLNLRFAENQKNYLDAYKKEAFKVLNITEADVSEAKQTAYNRAYKELYQRLIDAASSGAGSYADADKLTRSQVLSHEVFSNMFKEELAKTGKGVNLDDYFKTDNQGFTVQQTAVPFADPKDNEEASQWLHTYLTGIIDDQPNAVGIPKFAQPEDGKTDELSKDDWDFFKSADDKKKAKMPIFIGMVKDPSSASGWTMNFKLKDDKGENTRIYKVDAPQGSNWDTQAYQEELARTGNNTYNNTTLNQYAQQQNSIWDQKVLLNGINKAMTNNGVPTFIEDERNIAPIKPKVEVLTRMDNGGNAPQSTRYRIHLPYGKGVYQAFDCNSFDEVHKRYSDYMIQLRNLGKK